jgi:cation diffusion facilitator CzcD-associated flavoprotein CzcO
LLGTAFYQFCRRYPAAATRMLKKGVAELLPPDYPIERDFSPRYNPWDQRLCLVPDADLFTAISSGKVSIVTDTIDALTPTGVRVSSGDTLAADILVMATGLQLVPWGGIRLSVDGRAIEPRDTLATCASCCGTWTSTATISSCRAPIRPRSSAGRCSG